MQIKYLIRRQLERKALRQNSKSCISTNWFVEFTWNVDPEHQPKGSQGSLLSLPGEIRKH